MSFDLSNQSKLSKRKVNIQIEKSVWTSLKTLKKANETFNDVILNLLNQRSKEIQNSKIGTIEYVKKIDFISLSDTIGVQYECNDVKSISNFTLDIKIKKVYFEKRSYNPGEFFGVESKFFYINEMYLYVYFLTLIRILNKQLNIKVNSSTTRNELNNILLWRQLYYDYALSEESFNEDIEIPLRKSEDSELLKKFNEDIEKSVSMKMLR